MHAVFDLHCDTADRLAWQTLPRAYKEATGLAFYGPGDELDPHGCRSLTSNRCHISLDAIGDTPWAQCFACFIPDELSPEQALGFHQHIQADIDRQLDECAGRIRPAADGRDIPGILADGCPALVRTIENARFFALDPHLVDEARGRGVLMASLSWNAAGPLASGHDTDEGLTQAGRAALARMARVGMAIDVSHLNDRCFADVAASTDAPLVASHSNSRAVCGHSRNLTDAQFDLIRERGGLVGLNFCRDFLRADGAPDFDDIRAISTVGSSATARTSWPWAATSWLRYPRLHRHGRVHAHVPKAPRCPIRRADHPPSFCGDNALRFFSNL